MDQIFIKVVGCADRCFFKAGLIQHFACFFGQVGKIAAVKVLKHGETDMIIAAPIETMIPEIVAKNGVEGVESVGGATMSSDGIKAAVQDGLAKAK